VPHYAHAFHSGSFLIKARSDDAVVYAAFITLSTNNTFFFRQDAIDPKSVARAYSAAGSVPQSVTVSNSDPRFRQQRSNRDELQVRVEKLLRLYSYLQLPASYSSANAEDFLRGAVEVYLSVH
jgi:hypothetical protein